MYVLTMVYAYGSLRDCITNIEKSLSDVFDSLYKDELCRFAAYYNEAAGVG